MRVSELTLHNFRVFGELRKFEFSNHVTVMAGVNGRGKTAVLDALALLASRLLPLISPGHSGYRTITPSEVHGDELEADLGFKVNCAGIPINFKLTYARDSRKLKRTTVQRALRDRVREAYDDPNRAGNTAPLAIFYTTDRAGFRLPRRLPTELPRERALAYVRALQSPMVDYRDFMARYRAWVADAAQARSVTAFNNALSAFLDGFSDVQVEESPLRLTVGKGGHRLSLSQLSDGERSFLAIVSDLVRRLSLANPDLNDPLQGAGVVLIDEIELHLHPTWQRHVVEKLRTTFPHIQFIATTHSPFVIQSLRAGELINLDPGEFGDFPGKSIEDISTMMGVEVPQRSERFLAMVRAAEEYYAVLERTPAADAEELARLKARLDELAAPYSEDPAYVAFLNFQRRARLRDNA
jgi:predicted ATPase